jgi:excisionase family DNA binding protein
VADTDDESGELSSAPGEAGAEAAELLTVAEVAGMWRVSKMTIYRMIDAGEVPAVRIGRSYRIRGSVASEIGKRPDRRGFRR